MYFTAVPRSRLFRSLKLSTQYCLRAAKLLWQHPRGFRPVELLWDFPSWLRSHRKGAIAVEDERPWMAFSVIRFLDEVVGPQSRIFEYGSGGSTLFFARRAAEVVSTEHDPAWFKIVQAAMQAGGYSNGRLRLIKPKPAKAAAIPTGGAPLSAPGKDPADPHDYTSVDDVYRGLSFREYASHIDEYTDGTFDVVVVDGRARPSCFMHALPKVKAGGWLLLDNSDRDYYQPVMRLADEQFCRRVLRGPAPYSINFEETSLFQRQ